MQLDGLDRLHGHLKNYTHAVQWIGRIAWPWQGLHGLHGTRMQLDGFDWDTCLFAGLYCAPRQVNGLERLRGHDKVQMDRLQHKCI
jgi:hypothetical protein